MQANSSSSTITNTRCQHLTAAGRQCRSLAADNPSGFCPHHAAAAKAANFRELLTREAENFQRAQGVNRSLGALYKLLAEDRISARRASVLAYISSLLLRSLPAIDYDNDRFPVKKKKGKKIGKGKPEAPSSLLAPPTLPVASEPVPPGKDPLPETAAEFVDAVLARKPN